MDYSFMFLYNQFGHEIDKGDERNVLFNDLGQLLAKIEIYIGLTTSHPSQIATLLYKLNNMNKYFTGFI